MLGCKLRIAVHHHAGFPAAQILELIAPRTSLTMPRVRELLQVDLVRAPGPFKGNGWLLDPRSEWRDVVTRVVYIRSAPKVEREQS